MSVGLRAQVQRAAISNAAIGDFTAVAAVAGKLITVVGLMLTSVGATTVTIKDGTGGTAMSGAMTLNAGLPLVLPDNGLGGFDWFQTSNPANNLAINNSTGTQVSGTIWYIQV